MHYLLSHVWLFETPLIVAHQAPLSTEFSRQAFLNGLPFHSPGNLSNPWIEPRPPILQEDSLLSDHQGSLFTSSLLICLLLYYFSFPRKIPWRREWQPTPVFLPGESHGQRRLAGYRSLGSQRFRHNWVTKSSPLEHRLHKARTLPKRELWVISQILLHEKVFNDYCYYCCIIIIIAYCLT